MLERITNPIAPNLTRSDTSRRSMLLKRCPLVSAGMRNLSIYSTSCFRCIETLGIADIFDSNSSLLIDWLAFSFKYLSLKFGVPTAPFKYLQS